MSNEYKEWKNDEIEYQKRIVDKYPFLRARDIDGAIDTESKFPMMGLEIPKGWYRLFFQMCDDIKPLLEKESVIDDFYFIQCKEKYNQLVCYSNGIASQEIEDIILKYGHMAYYVCIKCGQPADCETQDYLASFCTDCWKDHVRHEKIEWIKFNPEFKISGYKNGKDYEKIISFEEEWSRYLNNFKSNLF